MFLGLDLESPGSNLGHRWQNYGRSRLAEIFLGDFWCDCPPRMARPQGVGSFPLKSLCGKPVRLEYGFHGNTAHPF